MSLASVGVGGSVTPVTGLDGVNLPAETGGCEARATAALVSGETKLCFGGPFGDVTDGAGTVVTPVTPGFPMTSVTAVTGVTGLGDVTISHIDVGQVPMTASGMPGR